MSLTFPALAVGFFTTSATGGCDLPSPNPVTWEKTLEGPLDCKEIKPVNPKGNQSWVFTGRTDVEAEATILWLPDENSQLTGKDPDAGKDRRQKEKRAAENEMVR